MTRPLIVAVVFAALAAPAPAAEPLGRLFFTPAQRSSLDVARSQKTRAAVATEQTEQEAAPVPEVISYEGMVRRSDGQSTIWINNRPVHEREAGAGTPVVRQVRPDGSVTLQVPQSGQRVDLRVGQSIELLSGSVEEGFARRVTVPEAKPAAKPRPGTAPAEKKAEESPAQPAPESGAAQAPAAPGNR